MTVLYNQRTCCGVYSGCSVLRIILRRSEKALLICGSSSKQGQQQQQRQMIG